MLFLTHLLFSLFVGILLFAPFPAHNPSPLAPSLILISVCTFFGVFPDIDGVRGKIKKWIPFSMAASFFLGHRGIFHSLVIPGSLWLLSAFLGKSEIGAAIMIGYSSHLFLDALTPKGIAPFYPFSKKRISGPIKTGSFMEYLMLFLFIVIAALLWLK